jgi:hypothetical protein
MIQTKGMLAMAAALWMSASAVLAQDVLHARVSHDAGALLVQGRGDAEWANAPINSLVLPGDTVWIDQQGTAELELPGGAYLRLADGSKAELTAMTPTTSVRAWMGSFYVHRVGRASGDFVVTTPSATVEVHPDSSVRIDVNSAGATVVSVRFGYAKVLAPQANPVGAGAGTRVFVDPGLLPSEAVPFSLAEEDAFDQWNRERIKLIVTGPAPLPASVQVASNTLGVNDLGRYGEWVQIESRSYWRPTVVVDYVPYRHGYWSYVPAYGHVWVGNYGFSYVTSHYGRWAHYPSHGWVWSYDPVWSPAWVASVRVGSYHVWTPIDYYNRPVYWGDSAYFSVGGLRFSYASSSYVPYDHLYYGPGYVGGLYGTNFTNIYADEVNIWNIYNKPDPRYRVPYRSTGNLAVRDYAPNRSVRGPQVYGGSRSATDRVRTLEANAGRNSFDVVNASDRRSVRTGIGDSGRAASVRTVSRIENTDRDVLIRQSTERAATVRSARTDVDSNVNNVTRPRGTAPAAGTPTRGGDTSVRTAPSTSTPTRGGDTSVRTAPSTSTPTRGGDTSVRTAPSTRTAPDVSRTPSTSTRTAPSVTTAPSSRTAPTTVNRTAPSTRSTPPTVDRTTPTTRTAPSTTSTRSTPQVIRTQPSTSPRITVTGPSNSTRTSPGVSTSPTTRSTPNMVDRSVPTTRTAPSTSAPRSAPQSTRSLTPSPSRSYSQPAPSRSISAPAPSRSISAPAPSRSISAPAPSRSISAPSPAPSRSFSAPSSNPSRSFSAPAPSRSISAPAPSRSISAPAPSRSFSAPSSSPSRSFSAPSSSSDSRRGIAAPSAPSRGVRGGR